jgi:hypothetical protein
LIPFLSDANSATPPNSGILAADQGNKTAEQRNCSGICLSAVSSAGMTMQLNQFSSVVLRPAGAG